MAAYSGWLIEIAIKQAAAMMMLESDDIKAVTPQDILDVQHQLSKKLRDNTLVIVADINPAEIKPLVRQICCFTAILEVAMSLSIRWLIVLILKERMDISINTKTAVGIYCV